MTMRVLCLPLLAALAATCTPLPSVSHPPPDPPTFQKVAAVTGGTNVSWHNPSDADFDLALVVRYSGPRDGKPGAAVPAKGDGFGSGTVVYVGADTSFVDMTLPMACSTFTYQFWAHDRKGQWSEGAVEATTLPGGLPAPVKSAMMLAVKVVGAQLDTTWVAPPQSSGATSAKIVRQLGTPATTSDQGTAVYTGTATEFVESTSGLPRGQTLFYSAFGCNFCGACSAISGTANILIPANMMDAGTPDAGPIATDGGAIQPSSMAAGLSADGQTVQLSWTNPPMTTGFTQVKVLRLLGSPPAGPNDTSATTLFTGLGTSAQQRLDQLLPSTSDSPRTYYYSVYGCADALCEGNGAQATFSATVAQALHGGGYTLWWRHLPASDCSDQVNLGTCTKNGATWTCPSNNWWKSCVDDTPTCSAATARQLTPGTLAGPGGGSDIEALTIHNQFMMRGFSIGRVLASEFCRAQHSVVSWHDAQNTSHPGFDFGPTVESVKELTYYVYDEANRCANTQALLNEMPDPGKNTAMVSHAGFSCQINGGRIDSLNWGDCAIFKPDPVNGPVFIQSVAYDGWSTLP
jgi:hypothetical protein